MLSQTILNLVDTAMVSRLTNSDAALAAAVAFTDNCVFGLRANEERIAKLMKEPMPVGVDGDNAQGIMYDHIGDDSLFDDLYELSQRKGAEADARPVIKKYAEMFMPNNE